MRGMGVGVEAGVYGADVAVTEEYLDIISETFSENKGITSKRTVGYRAKRHPQVGSFDANGGYSMCVAPEMVGVTLLSTYGLLSDTYALIGMGEGSHTFTPKALPSYMTAGIVKDITDEMHTYPGTAIKTMKIAVKPGEEVVTDVDCFCQTINVDVDAVPAPSALPPFVAEDGCIEIDTVANTDIKMLNLNITNNWEEGQYRIGSITRKYAKFKGIDVDGSVEMYLEGGTSELKNFLNDSAAALPDRTVKKRKLEVILENDEQINGVTNYYLDFVMEEVVFKTLKDNISEQDEQIQVLDFEAYQKVGANHIIQSTLKNAVLAAYDV